MRALAVHSDWWAHRSQGAHHATAKQLVKPAPPRGSCGFATTLSKMNDSCDNTKLV